MDVDSDAETCPFCGYEFPRQKGSVKLIAVVIILLMLWPLFKLIQSLMN